MVHPFLLSYDSINSHGVKQREQQWFGLYWGLVEDNNDPEKLQRVKVRVYPHHNDEEKVKTEDLPWAHCTGMFGGLSDEGTYQVPSVGSQVIVSFVHGDPDYPIVLGTVYGAPDDESEIPSEVKDADDHRKVYVYKTPSDHKMIMDENESTARIEIKTSAGHYALLDDANGVIQLKTVSGHTITLDDPNGFIKIETSSTHADSDTPNPHIVELDDKHDIVKVTTGGGWSLTIDDNLTPDPDLQQPSGAAGINLDYGFKAVSPDGSMIFKLNPLTRTMLMDDTTLKQRIRANGPPWAEQFSFDDQFIYKQGFIFFTGIDNNVRKIVLETYDTTRPTSKIELVASSHSDPTEARNYSGVRITSDGYFYVRARGISFDSYTEDQQQYKPKILLRTNDETPGLPPNAHSGFVITATGNRNFTETELDSLNKVGAAINDAFLFKNIHGTISLNDHIHQVDVPSTSGFGIEHFPEKPNVPGGPPPTPISEQVAIVQTSKAYNHPQGETGT